MSPILSANSIFVKAAVTYPPSPNPLGMPHYDDLLGDANRLAQIYADEAAGRISHTEAVVHRVSAVAHAWQTWHAMEQEVRLKWQNDGQLVGDENGHYHVYEADASAADVHPVMPSPG